jgi:uncharacterized protein
MTASDFVPALIGGACIGASASLLMLGLGRIAGISGIVNGAIDAGTPDRVWRWAFLAAIVVGAWLAAGAGWASMSAQAAPGPWLLAIGGLLVGFGTRMGSGCTSGHGVCGLARFSRRSLIATLAFMASGMLTVFVIRHVLQRFL